MMKPQHQSGPATLSALPTWNLASGEVGRIGPSPCARWLVVERGRVWLTASGELARTDGYRGAEPLPVDLPQAAMPDHWLAAGEQMLLPAGSEWVIEAGGDARLAMGLAAEPAPRRPLSARFWAWLRRAGAVLSSPTPALRLP